MRNAAAIMMLLLLLGFVGAAELQVTLTDTSFTAVNCRQDSKTYYFDVPITVRNPFQNALSVSYQWYNRTLGAFVNSGTICNVGAGALKACTVTMYSGLGGTNGTDAVSFNVIGTDGKNTWTKTMSINLVHYPGIYEQNVTGRIEIANQGLLDAYVLLSNCSNSSIQQLLTEASLNITTAGSDLDVCDLVDSINLANSAINTINQAKSYMNSSQDQTCGSKVIMPEQNLTPPVKTPTQEANTTKTGTSNSASVATNIAGTNCLGVTLMMLAGMFFIATRRS